jgi:hypothetical protein
MRYKANIILIKKLFGCQARLDKVVRFFADVYRYGHGSKQQHTKDKRDQKFFKNIAIKLLHNQK